MGDHPANFRHVLRVVAAHHFAEDEVQCGRAIKPQMIQRRALNDDTMREPVPPQNDLPFLEDVREIDSQILQFSVGRRESIPEARSSLI